MNEWWDGEGCKMEHTLHVDGSPYDQENIVVYMMHEVENVSRR